MEVYTSMLEVLFLNNTLQHEILSSPDSSFLIFNGPPPANKYIPGYALCLRRAHTYPSSSRPQRFMEYLSFSDGKFPGKKVKVNVPNVPCTEIRLLGSSQVTCVMVPSGSPLNIARFSSSTHGTSGRQARQSPPQSGLSSLASRMPFPQCEGETPFSLFCPLGSQLVREKANRARSGKRKIPFFIDGVIGTENKGNWAVWLI